MYGNSSQKIWNFTYVPWNFVVNTLFNINKMVEIMALLQIRYIDSILIILTLVHTEDWLKNQNNVT